MEQQNLQNNDEIEIDVLELFHVLLDKIWVIILAGASGCSCGCCSNDFIHHPTVSVNNQNVCAEQTGQ